MKAHWAPQGIAWWHCGNLRMTARNRNTAYVPKVLGIFIRIVLNKLRCQIFGSASKASSNFFGTTIVRCLALFPPWIWRNPSEVAQIKQSLCSLSRALRVSYTNEYRSIPCEYRLKWLKKRPNVSKRFARTRTTMPFSVRYRAISGQGWPIYMAHVPNLAHWVIPSGALHSLRS